MKLTLQFALVLFLQYSITFAQPGQLDLSFNPNGVGAFGGTLPPNYQPEVDGLVYKSKIYTSGPHKDKIIIIGRFTSFNGVPRKYIARLFPDGTVDASFANPALTTGYLYCVEILPSGKILIGGVFTVVGTTAIKNIARLNADGTVDTSFNPAPTGTRGTNAEVHALTMQDDGKILIGGVFTLFNGAGNKRLVRLNPDGTQDATFNATGTPTGEIRVIALQKTGANAGKIIVGGFFTGFTGYTKNKILRLLPNGDFDPTFNTTGNGATGGDAVFDVYVRPDDSMYAVGKFTKYNNVDKRSIVFLNAEGGLVTAFNPGGIGVSNAESSIGTGSGYNIFAILPQPDGKLLIGGNFTQYNGTNIPKGITRLTDNGLLDDTFLTGAGFTGGTEVYQGKSVVRHITLQVDGKILVSGDFTQYNNTDRRMLARIKTAVCGDLAEFTSDNTWINGIAPTGDSYYTVISGGVCTISVGANIEVCELELRAGATLLIEPHASITIKNRIINNGTIIVEDSGSLVQINDSSDNSDQGTGTFIMKRNTTPVNRYDYTYWSSPVQGQTLHDLSPATLADKYFEFDTAFNQWQLIPGGNTEMQPAKGYIIRAPQTFSTTVDAIYPATFTGSPNNGIYTPTIVANDNNNMNLLGNPYPSAIDADLFLSAPENLGVVNGTIYLWTHNSGTTANGAGQFLYSDDYAAYNMTGSVQTSPFATPFHGKIAAGQSFFLEGTANSTALFKNSMRIAEGNDQFFREPSNNGHVQDAGYTMKNRYWLDISNELGGFNQMLVGYMAGATTGFDRNYDGKVIGNNAVKLYSVAHGVKYKIQGRPYPLDTYDRVQIGYKSVNAGTFQISLSNVEGLFDQQAVYLEDKLLHVLHNLKEAPYTFTTAAGTFDTRFEIRYRGEYLSTAYQTIFSKVGVAAKDQTITVQSENADIKEVHVFDVTGKLLYTNTDVNATLLPINMAPKNQMLLVRIKLDTDEETVKKIMF